MTVSNGEKNISTLIVGSAGMIGRALVNHFRQAFENVIGADILKNESNNDSIFLDLACDLTNWEPPCKIKTAYICAGVTKLDECRRDPNGSFRINVTGTINIIKTLVDNGAFVVFLSSNQVFDGSIPYVEASHPQCPANEYGRQKAEAEKILGQYGKNVAIVRMTKVVGQNSLFGQWSRSLKDGKVITPFIDMMVSPVPLTSVISILRLIGDLHRGGIWHISGNRDITYADAAYLGASAMNASTNLIKPISVYESGLYLETNPPNTTLKTDRILSELGITLPPVEETIKQVF